MNTDEVIAELSQMLMQADYNFASKTIRNIRSRVRKEKSLSDADEQIISDIQERVQHYRDVQGALF